ncbi:MAG: hypothetical protein EOP83_19520, partial [Verrucomicrobiaceae bacterium]
MKTINYYLHVNHVESEKRFEYGPFTNLFAPAVGEFFVLPLHEDETLQGEVTAKTTLFDPGITQVGPDQEPKIIIEISWKGRRTAS